MSLVRILIVLACFILPLLFCLNSCESDPVQGDTTGPDPVTDLSLDSTKSNTLFFSWTATGDDRKSGTASFYDLRYAFDSATVATWGGATVVQGEPIPSGPGTHEGMTLNLELLDSTYYFGLKVSDESRNTSPLSNLARHHPPVKKEAPGEAPKTP